MLGEYYYHEIVKKTIIAFGTLFNNINIKHKKQDGSDYSTIKVPIAYGPVEKFTARLEQKPDLRNRVSIVLPRLAFEMTSIQYDNTRKVSTMQTFKALSSTDNQVVKKVFMPAPYNIGIQLSIITQYNDDALQIIEQILPYFQPSFNLTINLVSSIGEKRDIPMILENISFKDNYDSGYEEKRIIIYDLTFTAKTYLFGPIPDNTEGFIKKVQVDYYSNTDTKNASRQLRYVAEPRAIKDYNADHTTYLVQDIDDKITKFIVNNAISLVEDTYIQIDDEEMYIKSIYGNTITVLRGRDNSSVVSHLNGSYVNLITIADDNLIEQTDDFGFDEYRYDYGDGKIYSPSKGIDV
jgi:hypothetical protein